MARQAEIQSATLNRECSTLTVESLSAEQMTSPEPATITTTSSDDAEMSAVWDRLMVNNGADRADDGKFQSADPEKREAARTVPLEGGSEGEAAADTSTVTADVPLPPNWQGRDALWAKLPADVKAEVAAFQSEQHAKFSDMGRKLAAYEPLGSVGAEITDYLRQAAERSGGAYDGPQSAAEGVAYLFNIQRMMDADPSSTILQIMDTYGVRDQIAAMLGGQSSEGADSSPGRENALLAEIRRLESIVRQSADPQRIEQIVDQKTARQAHDAEVSRLLASKPLANEIEPDDLVFFINKAWKALGPDAAKSAVFDHAYNAAVEASPTLRAKSSAAVEAARDASQKAQGAKRATSVNVTSTGPAKPRIPTEDELLEAAWDKAHKG